MPIRGEFFQNPGGGGAFYSHQIEQSVRFEQDAGDKLSYTPSSSGNRRTFTTSMWYKKTHNSNSGNHMVPWGADARDGGSNYFQWRINNSDGFGLAGNGGMDLQLNRVLRDLSGWSNIIVAYDSTQGTASNRVKIYFNGLQDTSLANTTYPSQNFDTTVNQSGVTHDIGVLGYGSNSTDFAGYVAEFVHIDGTAYGPDSFGEFKGGNIWIPKDPSGLTFGTNGVYLKFENASDLGNDSSGNNNDWSATNMSADRKVLDSPTFGSN